MAFTVSLVRLARRRFVGKCVLVWVVVCGSLAYVVLVGLFWVWVKWIRAWESVKRVRKCKVVRQLHIANG